MVSESNGKSMFDLIRNCQTVFKVAVTFSSLSAMKNNSTSSPKFGIFRFGNASHSDNFFCR